MSALRRLFDWKIRGVRWIEIMAAVLVAVLLGSTYLIKASAQREAQRIAELKQTIAEDARRVRLLRAEVARLESPRRLEALSRDLGLTPSGARPVPAPAAPAPAPEAALDFEAEPAQAAAVDASEAEG